ncbi:membrane protein [Rhodopirellula maiorica SM1]|uniref:Membrane protein n=2 Tax=Novipirellula TaxID=2795426 RepID=M5RM96_9BACT|nr:membrane protein [Rhodopirellula maiorica SM1]
MSSTPATEPPRSSLRSDLDSIRIDEGQRAARLVIDDVSGRFSRISERAWQQLCRRDAGPMLWKQAHQAGWTRTRSSIASRRFSLLAIRIPIGSIDGIANWMAGYSGVLFAPIAIMLWSAVIVAALLLAISRSPQWIHGLQNLPYFLSATHSLLIAATFLATKTVHELAHAVMCRRMGARSKSVGIFLFCGVPSPYCDVTDVWRLPSAIRRAAVMLAGIYVELIIAAIATFVWCAANDPAIRLLAMNLMIVCGVSTVLFNANPLMRYDGYFVLMDWVRSTNLRREARDCFQATVTSRIAGAAYGRFRRHDFRGIALSIYHAASLGYRSLILIAIATLLLSVADAIHLRFVAVVIVTLAATAMLLRQIKSLYVVLRGEGHWMRVRSWRRFVVVLTLVGMLIAVLLIPVPRYRHVVGIVDAADAVNVFLPPDSQIQTVATEVGEHVREKQLLATLANSYELIEQARLDGELRLAELQTIIARRSALDRPQVATKWATLQAAEDSVKMLLNDVHRRLDQTNVVAPVAGTILPPSPRTETTGDASSIWMAGQVGGLADSREPWCRISPQGQRQAIFRIDARDHDKIIKGSEICVHLQNGSTEVFSTEIQSVSAIEIDSQSITQEANYQILCPLPNSDSAEMMDSLGATCSGVIRLPSRAIAADLVYWISEFVRGQI